MSESDHEWVLSYIAQTALNIKTAQASAYSKYTEYTFRATLGQWDCLLEAYDNHCRHSNKTPTMSFHQQALFMNNERQGLQGTIAPKFVAGVRMDARIAATRHLASYICSLGAMVMIDNSQLRIMGQYEEALDKIEECIPAFLSKQMYREGNVLTPQPELFYEFRRDVPLVRQRAPVPLIMVAGISRD